MSETMSMSSVARFSSRDADFDQRVGVAGLVLVLFNGDPKRIQFKKRLKLLCQFLHKDFKCPVRHIKLVTFLLQALDFGHTEREASDTEPVVARADGATS